MKKGLTALFLSLVMTFMLCACGSPKTYDPINTTNAGFNFSEDLARSEERRVGKECRL